MLVHSLFSKVNRLFMTYENKEEHTIDTPLDNIIDILNESNIYIVKSILVEQPPTIRNLKILFLSSFFVVPFICQLYPYTLTYLAPEAAAATRPASESSKIIVSSGKT